MLDANTRRILFATRCLDLITAVGAEVYPSRLSYIRFLLIDGECFQGYFLGSGIEWIVDYHDEFSFD